MSWTRTINNRYVVGVTTNDVTTTDYTTPNYSDVILDDIGNSKQLLGIYVSVNTLDGILSLGIQYSHDGTNFSAITTIGNLSAGTTGYKLYITDLTNIRAPYYRLVATPSNCTLGSRTTKFIYTKK